MSGFITCDEQKPVLFRITSKWISSKYCGVVIPFVNGGYESWQDMVAMKKLLSRYGVDVIESKKGRFNILEGVLKN